MDNSEEMDLDSLMELLDDNETFEEEMSSEQVTINTTENNSVTSKCDRPQPARLKLKDMFQEDFLTPKVVENPKKDTNFNKPSLKIFPSKESVVHTGETDDEDEESKEYLTKTGQSIKKVVEQKLSLSHLHSKPKKPSVSTWTSKGISKSNSNSAAMDSSFVVDSYSGIRVVNPLVCFSTMQQRMDGRRMIKMSFIHNFIKNGDIEGDWVTMGVVIQKIPPKTSANGKTYSIWKMSDLHDVEKPVSIFLFKTAHTELWKTAVGTVIGILNPSIMPNKDNRGDLCLAVDQPGKCMMMGKSKDLGFCKSKRRDGTPCNVAVNIFQCEYCTYHIKKEYRKFSSKRSEIQSCFSGNEPSLKNKVLKGQNVFYGGQSFTAAAAEKKKPSKLKTKDKLTLSNLGLKRKAEALESVEKEKTVKKLSDLYGPDILKAAEKNSEYINEMLTVPTVGTRNLLQHLMKDKTKQEEQVVKVITPKEQLKLYQNRMNVNQNKQKDQSILKDLMPQIGRGLNPGQSVNFDFASPKRNTASDIAKLKAFRMIKEKGPLITKNPNYTKVSKKSADKDKVKAVLDRCDDKKKDVDQPKVEKSSVVATKLGTLDMNSEKVKNILSRKSSHMYEVEMAEMEKEAAYFNALEKKERMEEKMASTLEIVCDVVSCKKCKYTAHSAAEKCKSEQHPLKCHKAVKRFFACKDCKHRTFSFSKLPTHVCRVCKGSSFERTSMMKARKGPKLDAETLNIRGEEDTFLDSQCKF